MEKSIQQSAAMIASKTTRRGAPAGQQVDIGRARRLASAAACGSRKTANNKRHRAATTSSGSSSSLKPIKSVQAERRHAKKAMQANGQLGFNQFVGAKYLLLQLSLLVLASCCAPIWAQRQPQAVNGPLASRLPDLVSSTSDEPIVALIGQDAFISCVAKNLQNYTIIWRFTNNANGPTAAADDNGSSSGNNADGRQSTTQPIGAARLSAPATADDLGTILTAGRQRVTSDERVSIINSHDTWLLKISNVRPTDTGTYICHTNSEPQVRVPRILSVIKPSGRGQSGPAAGKCCRPSSATPSHPRPSSAPLVRTHR
jgi:hypothetical protein